MPMCSVPIMSCKGTHNEWLAYLRQSIPLTVILLTRERETERANVSCIHIHTLIYRLMLMTSILTNTNVQICTYNHFSYIYTCATMRQRQRSHSPSSSHRFQVLEGEWPQGVQTSDSVPPSIALPARRRARPTSCSWCCASATHRTIA